MNVLGFDTSTRATAVCVLRSDGEAYERVPAVVDLHEPPAHARELMPAIADLLAQAGLDWPQLDRIGVSRGPGSFTGLRIAAATARGLARAHGTPVRGVSALSALARGLDAPLALPLMDGGRGEVFGALYAGGTEVWEPFSATPAELLSRIEGLEGSPASAGGGSLRLRRMLEACGVRVSHEDSAVHVVRALHVCRLAADGPADPAGALFPLYLREPDARPAR